MNLREIIQGIRNRITHHEDLSNEIVLGFLRLIDDVEKEQITCDQLFEKLDEYVEREVDQKDASKLMPLVREHLDSCPDCCEEYEALLDVLEHETEK